MRPGPLKKQEETERELTRLSPRTVASSSSSCPPADLPPPEHLSRTNETSTDNLDYDEALEQARLQSELAQMDLPEPERVADAARRTDQGLGGQGVADGLAKQWEGMEMQAPEWLEGGYVLRPLVLGSGGEEGGSRRLSPVSRPSSAPFD